MTPNYFIHRSGQTLGPYSGSQLLNLLRAHQVALEDLSCTDADEEWKPVAARLGPKTLAKLSGAAQRVKWSEMFGTGLLVQALGLFVCVLPPWIVTVPLGLCVIIAGSGMARGLKCSACGTKLRDRKAPRCPGCSADFSE